MKLTRRQFLRIAGGTGVLLPSLIGQSACAPELTTTDPTTGLSLGYVAGDATSNGAMVWLRAEPDSPVSLQFGKEATLSRFISVEPLTVNSGTDYTVHFTLEGLEPATVYYYRGAVAGKKPGPIAKFVTAPALDENAVVKFCFSGDSRFGFQPFTVMDAIREMKPHFFLHLGDTIYADREGRASRLDEYWAKYRQNRDLPSQRLFSETSAYVMWDDHEVANDYEAGHPLMPVGRQAFFDYWPIRRTPHDAYRLYRSFRWGRGLELFMLDVRQYRDRATGTILGSAQKKWLFEALAKSSAIFKLIATPVPFYGGGRDKWDGFPRERDELLRWITSEKIRGVVFLSADVHYASVRRVPGNLGLKEITAGPIAAQMNVVAAGTSRRYEFFSNKTFNYAMVSVDPRSPAAQIQVEILDQDNLTLYKTRIAAV